MRRYAKRSSLAETCTGVSPKRSSVFEGVGIWVVAIDSDEWIVMGMGGTARSRYPEELESVVEGTLLRS